MIERLGITLPILQAPMAGVQDHRLAVAVSEAGGLGALPAAMLTHEQLAAELKALRAATARPFNLNFFCHRPPEPDAAREAAWRATLAPFYREHAIDPAAIPAGPGRTPFSAELAGLIEAFRPPVVSFHFGLPSAELVARVKRWGARVLSSATTVDEARWLEARGVDAVIAQGLEAGGHRGMFLNGDPLDVALTQSGTMALVPQVADAVDVPVIAAGGKLALAFVIIGIVAATFGAALETTLSSGYTLAQFFGWAWGKFRRPAQAARFHTVMLVVVVACAAVLFTGIDPILVTEYSVVFSAIALPLTYLPILIVANDPGYMGEHVNGSALNAAATVYLVVILAASLAAIPLMIVTGAGQ